MLEADNAIFRFDSAETGSWPHPATATRGSMVPASGVAVPWERTGYRASGGARLPAMALSALAVAGLLAAFVSMNVAPRNKPQAPLVVMRLSTTPPPPTPTRKTRPQPAHTPRISAVSPPVAALAPVVSLPAPPVALAAAPAPVIAPPAPPAPPAPAARPAPGPADGGDLSAKMISAKPPTYPLESRRKHEQGTVVLSLTLATDGTVEQIGIARSSGFDRLDQAALKAVRQWRWAPVTRDGVAVMVRGQVRIPFQLKA